MSEDGSKSEPARSTRVKGGHVRIPSSFGPTHWQKNILLLNSTHPCSRVHLQSLASSASSLAKCHSSSPSSHTRGMLLFWYRALLLQSIWHSLAHMKGDVFCISNQRTNGACHQGLGFLHTSHVYDPVLQHLSQHGLCVVLYFCSHQTWRSHRQSKMTMPPLQQYQNIRPTCRW